MTDQEAIKTVEQLLEHMEIARRCRQYGKSTGWLVTWLALHRVLMLAKEKADEQSEIDIAKEQQHTT